MNSSSFKKKGILPTFFYAASILFILGISFVLDSNEALDTARVMIGLNINDLERVLKENKQKTNTIQLESDAQAIAKSHALAYMIFLKPSIIGDARELERIRKLLDVDELHVTDNQGIIVGSTVNSYLGYDFASDPQSKDFLLGIYYKDFELAQKPMPKGINKAMFQYAGVARIDQPGIVQIGYKPERLEEVMKTVDISNITKNWRLGSSGQVLLADLDGSILSTFDGKFVGKNLTSYGFRENAFNGADGAFFETVKGQDYYFVYQVYENVLIIAVLPEEEIFANRNNSFTVLALVGLCMIVLSSIMYLRRKSST